MHRNTADSSYLLFTREAGMLFAAAKSVREERSRQRFALQDFSLIRITLIRGKSGWRVGSVESYENFYAAATDKAARGSVVAIVRFLRRFVHGEESHQELYDYLISSLREVLTISGARTCVDAVVQLRALEMLGYVSSSVVPSIVRTTALPLIPEVCSPALVTTIERIIDSSVSASHL
jgi:recombinational DNA repair protein (RecF pathway)